MSQGREGLLLPWTILACLLVAASASMIALSDDRAVEGMGIVLNVIAGAMVCPLVTFLFDWITAPSRHAEIRQALADELDKRGINRESLASLAVGVLFAGIVIVTIIVDITAPAIISVQALAVLANLVAAAAQAGRRRRRRREASGDSPFGDE